MERVPRNGELYRHFKNKLYQIVTVATHSETREKLVIYQALYGDYQVYARPLEMFVSEVDHEKYPEVAQKYRFERVERPVQECVREMSEQSGTQEVPVTPKQQEIPVSSESLQSATDSEVNPKLLAFLDADDMEEKYHILVSMRDEVDNQLINNMAVAVDVVIPDGDVSNRYEQLKNCIKTRQRYEIDRLR